MADDAVDQFTSVTGASREQATFYLESAGGNVEAAIDSFFNTGGGEAHEPDGEDDAMDDEGLPDAPLASVPSTGAITRRMHALSFCATASETRRACFKLLPLTAPQSRMADPTVRHTEGDDPPDSSTERPVCSRRSPCSIFRISRQIGSSNRAEAQGSAPSVPTAGTAAAATGFGTLDGLPAADGAAGRRPAARTGNVRGLGDLAAEEDTDESEEDDDETNELYTGGAKRFALLFCKKLYMFQSVVNDQKPPLSPQKERIMRFVP